MATQLTAASNQFWHAGSTPGVTGPPFTVSAWFRLTSDPTTNDFNIWQIQDSGASNHYFRGGISDDTGLQGRLSFGITAGGSFSGATSTINVTQNQWQHGLWTATSDTRRDVYLDGGNGGNDTTNKAPSGIDSIDIGNEGDSTPGDTWNGQIGEVIIWNVVLNAAELASLAGKCAGIRIRPLSIKHWWPFWLGTDGTDRVGTLNLTGTNSPTHADHAPVAPPFAFNHGWYSPLVPAAPASVVPQAMMVM